MSAEICELLLAQRVVPVLRLASAELTERAARCIAAAGFMSVEITLTVPGAIELIGRLARSSAPGVVVGAGTVLDLEAAQRCVDAGARFVVSPCIVPGMAKIAHAAGCAALSGGFTPGEILAAQREGADMVNGFKISRSDPLHRKVVGRLYHGLVKTAFGLETPDVDCDFRLIRRSVFDDFRLTRDSGLICVELVTKIEKTGHPVRYVPVHHYHRLHGRSQFFNFRRVGQVALGLGRLWWELIVQRRIRA